MKRIVLIGLLILLGTHSVAGTLNSQACCGVEHSDGIQPTDCYQDATDGSDPKAQALKLYTVIKNQDWKTLYSLILVSPKVRLGMPEGGEHAEEFAAGMRDGISKDGGDKVADALFNNITDIAVGEPVVRGNKAEVPTSATITLKGKAMSFKGSARLANDRGVWKWDLTLTDDLAEATAQELQVLLGKSQ